ncbi:hypothetical protein [Streptomyces sp. enrichment culture]|uniref:hypothetical protein n=1 Tax=Streptomyces sp. enrichment culture TaxID=1795815 RepID=UPI003F564E6F
MTGSALRRVPGAGMVSRAAEGTLDAVGNVSPRGRRMAVYTGAGLLGVAGVVEWPVAIAGAAVAWLTQPKPEQGAAHERTAGTEGNKTKAMTSAASRTASGGTTTSAATRAGMGASAGGGTAASPGRIASTGRTTASGARTRVAHGTGTTTIRAATAHRRTAARRGTATMG